MSINSALSAGVAGLNAYSAGLAVISDNIANVNTVGYKRSTAEFSTLV
ncbi:MAG: flagellar basal body protein, partial [Pseudomonadota bacterium]